MAGSYNCHNICVPGKGLGEKIDSFSMVMLLGEGQMSSHTHVLTKSMGSVSGHFVLEIMFYVAPVGLKPTSQ